MALTLNSPVEASELVSHERPPPWFVVKLKMPASMPGIVPLKIRNPVLHGGVACDAIYGVFDLVGICGEVMIGEGIKDNAPGIFST